ncbi:helix-turn-helix domain-containing protein (plasmid) [Macrococcus psychrotolerans]|uniref:Helix-turn-helix domain-containing protein n=1 Tax=Macrococcus psychrotolerans TaxID=3039389 RepID=A0AAT9PB28_9STAP|nr:helix-turn-helix domain-containing protein [Macrococcus caseolyticus]QYA38996.1 helix-turn-helix domain-containing protein [Macrococcus caseolyticus]QYA77737.1 helix-turn-helix domain-containing protein [Macrococcus caseolyticus]
MTYIMNDFENNFETIIAMDRTVERYNRHLKKTEYLILNVLKQHSLKVIGYSHLKLQTIADLLNISKKTVYRILKNLDAEGYITKIHTVSGKRKNNGANVYRINTYTQYEILKEKNVHAKMSTLNQVVKTGKALSQQALQHVRAKKETIYFLNLLNIFLSNRKRSVKKHSKVLYHNIKNSNIRVKPMEVPDEIYNVAKPFFSDEEILSLYKVMLKETIGNNIYDTEDHIEIMIYAIQSLVKAKKKEFNGLASKIKNDRAYYIGILREYIAQHYFVYNPVI